MPNPNTSSGVIIDPPPTPVKPTSIPTTSPHKAKSGLIACNRGIYSSSAARQRAVDRLVLIGLVDLSISTCCNGERTARSLTQREISPAGHNQGGANESRNGRPVAKNENARNDHPNELGIGKRRQ